MCKKIDELMEENAKLSAQLAEAVGLLIKARRYVEQQEALASEVGE